MNDEETKKVSENSWGETGGLGKGRKGKGP